MGSYCASIRIRKKEKKCRHPAAYRLSGGERHESKDQSTVKLASEEQFKVTWELTEGPLTESSMREVLGSES